MNQFTLNLQPSDTLWYSPTPMEHQQQQPPPLKTYQLFYNNNNNNNNSGFSDIDSDNNSTTSANIETTPPTLTLDKEHMFEKPLTPSDVGKLNRLVIPKQHAEKYLPLTPSPTTTTNTADGGSGGGLLLSFEDETGKSWRFRYSYWNSSQSYVLTKGWSRYVKEKKLDAGDVVLFERHRFENERFFIGWRRRGASNPPPCWSGRSSYNFNVNNNNNNYYYGGYNGNYGQNVVQSQQTYVVPQQISAFANFRPDFLPDHGTVQARQKAKKSGSGNSKRVRLFGVNLECQLEDEDEVIEDEPQTSDGSSLSSQGHAFVSASTMGPTAYNNFGYVGYPPNHHNNHMDMNFPHDVNNQMRNRMLG